MLLARIIEASFAESDAAIAVRHLKTSGLLLFSADACPSTWSRKSCTAGIGLSKSNEGRHIINQRTTDVWQVRLRSPHTMPGPYMQVCSARDCSAWCGIHNMMQAGLPQVGRTAGARCALVSCSAPAATPASDHREHRLHSRAAALLPVPPHPAAQCRPAQMSRCKPAAV